MSKLPPAPIFGEVGQPSSIPPRNPKHFVCLRGPCRHFWHFKTSAGAGNPAETWEALGMEEPKQSNYFCLLHPSETELTDDNVYECNRWDPMTRSELVELKTRRDSYVLPQEESE